MLKLICNFFILRKYAFVRPLPPLYANIRFFVTPLPPPSCIRTKWMTPKPINKRENRSDTNNYRPVSILNG